MKWKQTGISLLLAVSLTAGLAPVFGPALKAEAAEDRTIMRGTSGISSPSGSTPSDYIYFGTYNDKPVQWRVLDAEKGNATGTNDSLRTSKNDGSKVENNNAMFLLSEYLLEKNNQAFNADYPYSNQWQGSNAQGWCKNFYTNSLTEEEKPAALLVNKSDGELSTTGSGENTLDFDKKDNILQATAEDRFFYLSAKEVETADYGFTNSAARVARWGKDRGGSWWWLRSPEAGANEVGYVSGTGYLSTTYAHDRNGARPAFNLNRNSVLFTSAVGDGVDGETDEILKEIPTYNGKEWKLTLLDQNRSSFTANLGADKKTITYSGEKTGDNEYISAIVAEVKEGKEVYTHYARLKKVGSGGDTVDVAIPFDMTGKKLYVFNEQCNDEKKTNYASKLKEITEATENAYTVNYEGMTALGTTGRSWCWMGNTENYTAQLQLAGNNKDNYILPTSIEVKVGGQPLTPGDGYEYTKEDGSLTIDSRKITDDITITANAVAKTYGLSIEGADIHATGNFGTAHAGYTSLPAAQTFQIENTGNQLVENIEVGFTTGADFFTLNTTGGGLPLTRERQQHLRYSRRGICREA